MIIFFFIKMLFSDPEETKKGRKFCQPNCLCFSQWKRIIKSYWNLILVYIFQSIYLPIYFYYLYLGCAAQPEVPRRRDRGRLPVMRCDPGQDEGNVQTLLEVCSFSPFIFLSLSTFITCKLYRLCLHVINRENNKKWKHEMSFEKRRKFCFGLDLD